jgi:hypothetical protein
METLSGYDLLKASTAIAISVPALPSGGNDFLGAQQARLLFHLWALDGGKQPERKAFSRVAFS